MEKLVLFNTDHGNLDMMLKVSNFDNMDNFIKVACAGRREWNNTDEEYSEFMMQYLEDAGYHVEYVDFEVFTDYAE